MCFDELRAMASLTIDPSKLPSRPPMVEFQLEVQRQGNTYLRTRPAILKNREVMARLRARGGSVNALAAEEAKAMHEALTKHGAAEVAPLSLAEIEALLEKDRKENK